MNVAASATQLEKKEQKLANEKRKMKKKDTIHRVEIRSGFSLPVVNSCIVLAASHFLAVICYRSRRIDSEQRSSRYEKQ